MLGALPVRRSSPGPACPAALERLEVGYVGSGPADLALSILADFLGHAHLERGLYWAFMVAFLSNDGPAVRDLRTTDIAAWIDAQPNGVRS